ncbi:MAG TPA: BlaI/MecI/CopY family transcriptional regulator [Planctomycetia bacterium]|nr:BlaI/MecI/CopY family transcriptional regulator [Planctomycetia bacterium]
MGTKDRPEPSKGELEIARLLWELGEATVRQVHDHLPPGRKIDFVTVQTYLRRLEAKGYAKTRLDGRLRVYSPAVRPKTVIRGAVDDFVERVFGGAALPLVHHLIEERGIDAAGIADLRALLDRLEREGEGHGKR